MESGARQGLCIDPVKGSIQFIDAYPASPHVLVRQVRRQCPTILKVREVIDVDQCGDRVLIWENAGPRRT